MQELARRITDPASCTYLRGRSSATALRLLGSIEPAEYRDHLREGFRRFGMILFRPACEGCQACVPIRVPVDRFRPTKGQRRVMRRNRDVQVEIGQPAVDAERLEVYHAFHEKRSARVGWKRQEIDAEEYNRTFLQNIVATVELRYRVAGRLAAVAYIDLSPEAVNSIYCFHHPDFRRRSLGTFDVLMQIELARRSGRAHLYLGYHVADCRSMAYKASFRPAEVLVEGAWRDLERGAGAKARPWTGNPVN